MGLGVSWVIRVIYLWLGINIFQTLSYIYLGTGARGVRQTNRRVVRYLWDSLFQTCLRTSPGYVSRKLESDQRINFKRSCSFSRSGGNSFCCIFKRNEH